LALRAAGLARPFRALLPSGLRRMLDLAPARLPAETDAGRPGVHPARGVTRMRVALLSGCVQPVLAPGIDAAVIRLLTRLGAEVVVAPGQGCCGALTHHLGRDGHGFAAANIRAWTAELAGQGLDAVIVTASGCGTTVKDYGFMFRNDPHLADEAARISALACDVTEVLARLGLPEDAAAPRPLRVAYHSACSMQHGQRLHGPPRDLLRAAGFSVLEVPEGHICCGSAGTYNLLQPDMADVLRARKAAHIDGIAPDVVATGNLGCMTQLRWVVTAPLVHTVELLDWACGGPEPAALAGVG
jgi:glycolate oxidase iron-sulfur subunit